MPALRPEDVDYELTKAFNAGDLSACCALYEEGASVVRLTRDGGSVAKERPASRKSCKATSA